jgi:hypothetical protein
MLDVRDGDYSTDSKGNTWKYNINVMYGVDIQMEQKKMGLMRERGFGS